MNDFFLLLMPILPTLFNYENLNCLDRKADVGLLFAFTMLVAFAPCEQTLTGRRGQNVYLDKNAFQYDAY